MSHGLFAQHNRQRWVEAVNAGSQAVPPFGVVEITGSQAADGVERLQVQRPTATGVEQLAVNGPLEIAAGSEGVVTLDSPVFALYNTAGVPANGQQWGVEPGSFALTSSANGFLVLGGAVGGRVQVIKVSQADTFWQFTLTEAMGATTANQAAATLLDVDGVSTGQTITAKDTTVSQMFSVLTNASNGWCFKQQGEYRIIQAECSADGGSFYNESLVRDVFRV